MNKKKIQLLSLIKILLLSLITILLLVSVLFWYISQSKKEKETSVDVLPEVSAAWTSVSWEKSTPRIRLPQGLKGNQQSDNFKLFFSNQNVSGTSYNDRYVILTTNNDPSLFSINNIKEAVKEALCFSGNFDEFAVNDNRCDYKSKFTEKADVINEDTLFSTIEKTGTAEFYNEANTKSAKYYYFGYEVNYDDKKLFIVGVDLSEKNNYKEEIKHYLPKVMETFQK